ncbi:MAG TPA: allantoicase [Thermoanaerobaculia bacterium]|jgi:allantoicase|nr:allantoicase [Thermoanaerobaculia bacterium]
MSDLLDLASERLGGSVLYANDDFFAEKENLLKPSKPVWKEHEYTDRGKWMDGWESRRKRVPGHDFAIVRLGLRGVVRSVVIDTAFFRGNYPESASLDGTSMRADASIEDLLNAEWRPLLQRSPLQGDHENVFNVELTEAVTHVRLNIFPDGGVARLRVHGEVVPDWRLAGGLATEVDLAAAENGGQVLTCSDMFFGPKHNLIMPGRAHNMSDGWETKRRRGPGHDWVIVELATEGRVRRIEVDTNHFKGNYPDTASIEGSIDGETWTELLPRTKLQAHTRHFFIDELLTPGPFTHLRVNVFPDGGISRLRVWCVATQKGRRDAALRHVNTLFSPRDLIKVCGSKNWAMRMYGLRPFAAWDDMEHAAGKTWDALSDEDRLEAFAAHPRIGERKPGWSQQEQSGTSNASEETMRALAEGNRAYEEKFGFVYLICATGKTADEMLASLRERITHSRDEELSVAADEQKKIMALRLEKLVL